MSQIFWTRKMRIELRIDKLNQKKDNLFKLHLKKAHFFKSQNPEIGRFDVVFEIGGKLLYAHKTMLSLDSDTFDAMLSERWTKKDEPIKIQDYSYDEYYEFLTFLYTGECKLTDSNIYSMVDIAEFYGVQLFKTFCNEYLVDMKITSENVFKIAELAEKYSFNKLQCNVKNFISNNFTAIITSHGFLKINKYRAKELIIAHKYEVEPEDVFKAVYNWSEKQAMKAQTANPNLILNDIIKAEMSDFLPLILFCGMASKFIHEFVVTRGFIFSSWNEVSKILCDRDRFFEGNVKVTNDRGQTLHGNVIPDKKILLIIESLKFSTGYGLIDKWCSWNTKFKIPSTLCPLKVRDGIEWYLFCNKYGILGVQHYTHIHNNDYLLAEMVAGPTTGFQMTSECKIEIV